MSASPLMVRDDGPAVERQIAGDMARRSVFLAPVLVGIGALGWGIDGALSAAVALVLVVVNFLVAAWLLSWAARISLAWLMGVSLGGFVLRLLFLGAVVFGIHGMSWFEPIPLCISLLVTHLGLLIWETRYVSTTLAFSGVSQKRPRAGAAPSVDSVAVGPREVLTDEVGS